MSKLNPPHAAGIFIGLCREPEERAALPNASPIQVKPYRRSELSPAALPRLSRQIRGRNTRWHKTLVTIDRVAFQYGFIHSRRIFTSSYLFRYRPTSAAPETGRGWRYRGTGPAKRGRRRRLGQHCRDRYPGPSGQLAV